MDVTDSGVHNKAPFLVTIGELYEKSGQTQPARERFVEAARLMPGLPSACQGLKRLADGAAPADILASRGRSLDPGMAEQRILLDDPRVPR